MSLGLRLELKQSQQLVMTPQLQQAIKLLQMSNLELADFVAGEVEANPLLSVEEPGEIAAPPKPDAEPALDSKVTAEGDLTLSAETFDTGAENLTDDSPVDLALPDSGWTGLGRSGGEEDMAFDARLSEAPTLRAHLLAQLGQSGADGLTRLIAAQIVEDLDADGLYRGDLEDMARRLGIGLAPAEAALALVQSCDPTGVGARDLAECLCLQLAEEDGLDPEMARLLEHIGLLATGRSADLCKAADIPREILPQMLAELRQLNPRPAAAFARDIAETLIPDIFLRRTDWGGWQVELNTDTLPRVLVDNRYAAMLARGDGETREFVSNCRNSANWLVKSLDQRARTILKVATEIVRHQETFFDQGITGLRPLTLKMVADEIDMHESTASRVTANKYIATDRGIFELKFFFTNAIGDGDGPSAEAVRHRIKGLIDAETAKTVLSDDAIVDILQKDGIDIARRTVAKYRKVMDIPSSVERRRRKALETV